LSLVVNMFIVVVLRLEVVLRLVVILRLVVVLRLVDRSRSLASLRLYKLPPELLDFPILRYKCRA